MKMLASAGLLGLSVLAMAPLRADHIPGHDPCGPHFPVPIPGPGGFHGGATFVTLIGPVEGTLINGTTIRVHYVSDGATPASELELVIVVPVDSGYREWVVTGKELGFVDGPGTFTGTLRTDRFNGEVWQIPTFPHSLIDLTIQAVGGGVEGRAFFIRSFIAFDVTPPPDCASTSAL